MRGLSKDRPLPTPEPRNHSISRVSLVVPIYNEANNIARFSNMLSRQKLPQGIGSVHVIFSNDGSKDKTKEIAENLHVQGYDFHIYDSIENHGIGKARILGFREAIRLRKNSGTEPSQHLIITTDVDTTFDPSYILSVVSAYRNDSLLLFSTGPIIFEFSKKFAALSNKLPVPRFFYKKLADFWLTYKFRQNNRRVKDYIHTPHHLGTGPNMAFRETAYVDYDTGRSVHEDTLRFLVERNKLRRNETQFIRGQKATTSARVIEKKSRFIPIGIIKYLTNIARDGVTPFGVPNELIENPFKEFIQFIDKKTYGLSSNEQIVSRKPFGKKYASRRGLRGADVRPARNLKTGELLPGRWVEVVKKTL